MKTCASIRYKNKRITQKIKSIAPDVLNSLNKIILSNTPTTPKSTKRGSYSKCVSPAHKLIIAKYASKHTLTEACKLCKFVGFKLTESTVRSWKNKYEKSIKSLGRFPKTPKQAGFHGIKKRRKRSKQNGETKSLRNYKRVHPIDYNSTINSSSPRRHRPNRVISTLKYSPPPNQPYFESKEGAPSPDILSFNTN
mmetsp:Transcript_50139/g.44951  ORF Transcript_50139/g.44951 Transcript_50139/m.44951 type:complete len:195 (-) Transcript_50139:512-1096(-)